MSIRSTLHSVGQYISHTLLPVRFSWLPTHQYVAPIIAHHLLLADDKYQVQLLYRTYTYNTYVYVLGLYVYVSILCTVFVCIKIMDILKVCEMHMW